MNNIKPISDENSRKVYIETYGCQMNVNDSEVILSILQGHGYTLTEDIEKSDLILANTCSIRDNAEQRVRGRIEQFRQQKKKRKDLLVGIVGCMAERLKEALLETGVVDIVAGPDAYRQLPQMIDSAAAGVPQVCVELSREETYAEISPVRMDKKGVSAFISIMRGCNNVCSYCVVPYTRGAERSRDPHSIVREACELWENGYKEVTLLGQNVDSYLWKGPDGNTVNFSQLLEMTAAVNPQLRIRFSTSYPSDITDEVLMTMASHENICHHIHLPVQSGSNVMLEKMRRKYTREWYLERVAKIREILPDCGITTDAIVGFSGETQQDFEDTLSLFREVVFDSAFMFQYSERPGTLASRKYPDDISLAVKTERLEQLIALQGKMSELSYSRQLGKVHTVLVEGPSKRDPDQLCGRSGNYMMCVFPAGGHKAGDYVKVEVTSTTPATLICKLLD